MIKNIYIVGPAEAGKSTFAQYLATALERSSPARSWPVGNTSAPLVRWLARIQAAGDFGTPGSACETTWKEYITENKNRFRPQLVELAEIAREILPYTLVALTEDAGVRIVTGLRKRCEFACGSLVTPEHMAEFSARSKAEGRIVIYVDHGHPGKPVDDGFDAEFYKSLAHYSLTNVGLDGWLQEKAGWLAVQLLKECA